MRETNYFSSLSKKWWFSYLFLVLISTIGYQWLNSSGTYTFQAEFDVVSPSQVRSVNTNPYHSPVNPFKLSGTYTHASLKKVAARLTLHDLTSETPFRATNGTFRYGDLLKVRKEITEYLNSSEQTVLVESRAMKMFMADLGYDIPAIKEKLTVNWHEELGKVSISFTSENPFLSAFVVNDLGREFARMDRQLRLTHSNTAVELFAASSQRVQARWASELPEAASTSEIDGKQYWLSAHFPSVDFWLKEGETLPPSILDKIRYLESEQEKNLRERLRTVSTIRDWVARIEKSDRRSGLNKAHNLRQQVLMYRMKLEYLNRQIYRIDQQLRHHYDRLPTNIKNDDWILIDEEASTNYITKNYVRELTTTVAIVSKLNQGNIRFKVVPEANQMSKTPNFLVYFWMMILSVGGFWIIEIIYEKLRLDEKS
jgi:hypothetical protein